VTSRRRNRFFPVFGPTGGWSFVGSPDRLEALTLLGDRARAQSMI